ncbi:YhcN/YlaJ family sporulation lipoprotein [Bacillus timonensis]|nr:YhcN/YlaJ family sporulation lipoprotein [Bacillus timonensis]
MLNIRYLTFPFAFFLLLGAITGCGGDQKAIDEKKQELIHVKNTTEEKIQNKSGQEIAKHLVDLATSIKNVNDATAVVVGKYAVVGIDVNAKLDRSRVETIKYSVAESLQHDPFGANAVVVADPDTVERLRQMGKEIQDGRPITGILDELAQIVGRVMPDVPSDIIQNDNIEPTEQNKSQLNENEEQNLENKQDEQSNHHKDN